MLRKHKFKHCKIRKDKKPIIDENNQYAVLSSEYIHHYSSMQNVITINLAITMGLIATYTAIVTGTAPNSQYTQLLLILLPFIGIFGTVSCIVTVWEQNKTVMKQQLQLIKLEKKLGFSPVHKKCYYKPVHVTLLGFSMFVILFSIALIFSLINLNFWGNCCYICKIAISLLLYILAFFIVVRLSKLIYSIFKAKLEGKV